MSQYVKSRPASPADEIAEEVLRRVRERLEKWPSVSALKKFVPVGVSARHVHLSKEVFSKLFGENCELQKLKDLTQTGQFAAKETVTIIAPNLRTLEDVRILGPVRNYTQTELSRSDGRRLGLELPVRDSSDLANTPGVVLVGPRGSVQISEGAVRAIRHIHMTDEDTREFGVRDGDTVSVKVEGEKGLTFDMVKVKVDPTYCLELHLDTDDANAAGLSDGDLVELIRG
ncbi:MAG: phosphate propanoyltransferase [Candidatus Eisenbacteria bacterium]|nr:phosphate propanoyltransferase [Candidatus Eisenbacteria bacterium]